MTKDVLLAIKGLQFDASQEESDIQTITAAKYYKKNNSHYVIYDEAIEGTDQTTKNMIKFKEKTLELTKKGIINVHMIFEENKKCLTNYATPFGDILIGIDAKKITMRDEDKTIYVNVDYTLDVNYEFLADCKISMKISEREAGINGIFDRI